MTVAMEASGLTPTGLPYRPHVPWGSHLCHFFRTADDLLATLVPFFAAGLANGEKCVWVAGDPISPAQARHALQARVPDLSDREREGCIEFVDYAGWCVNQSALNSDAVVDQLLAREADALRSGFRGLRLTGNVGQLDCSDWGRFRQHEASVHEAFRLRRIVAMCSYSLELVDSSGIVDVVRNHAFAVIRRNGVWEATDAATRIVAAAAVGDREQPIATEREVSEGEWKHAMQLIPDGVFPAESVAAFLAGGLAAGEAAVAIATQHNLVALERALGKAGIDVPSSIGSEALLLLDADETLAAFMLNGQPDASRFHTVIGSALTQVTTKHRRARLYGEMVDVLWLRGDAEAALELERLWNHLLDGVSARLLCGYSISNFDSESGLRQLRDVCSHHDSVASGALDGRSPDRNVLLAKIQVHEHQAGTEAARRRDAESAQQQALLDLRAAHERLAGLQVITAALAQALTVDDVCRVVTGEIARRVRADRSVLAVPDTRGGLTLLAHEGLTPGVSAQYSSFPEHADLPLAQAFRTGSPVWLASREEIAARFPGMVQTSLSAAGASVPVSFDGRVVGVIGFGFDAERAFEPMDQALFHDFATQVGGALERARLHEAVRASEATLAEMNRRKDDFMAVLGHELRNPLAPMLTALQVMKLRGDRAGERERAVIERQIMYVCRLVDDLLDVSRITRGKLELRRSVVEIGTVLAQAVELSSPIVEQRGHRLLVEASGDRLLVEADAVRLAQALGNLLTNAAKYTDPGGTLTVRIARDGDKAVLTVKDDGVGIPEGMLTDIFEPFVQVERTMERSQGGLGLGLTLVKTLIELHGGTVAAASAGPGRGSEFHVRLPALPPEHNTASPSSSTEGRAESETEGRRVLVVDDNPDGADSLAEVLRLLGHTADVAYDGKVAVTKAAGTAFDLVLLDINLPGIDGYEVARRIRIQAPERAHRFIAMTGFGTDDDRARSRDEGFVAHLVKPIDYDRLLGILQSM